VAFVDVGKAWYGEDADDGTGTIMPFNIRAASARNSSRRGRLARPGNGL